MATWNWTVLGISLALSWGAIAPAASAQTGQLDYTLSSQGSGSYEVLVRQAEQTAESLVRQSFIDNPALTEVSVRILGEHNGSEVPVLYVTVARSVWQNNPDIRTQARYFGRSSAVLLGFLQPQAIQTAALPTSYPTAQDIENSLSDTEPNFYD